MDTLYPNANQLVSVSPVADANGNVTQLVVNALLSYANGKGEFVLNRNLTFDAWPLLTPQQQAAVQGIQNALQAYVQGAYLT